MTYEEAWKHLKERLDITVQNFTQLTEDYQNNGDRILARHTRTKCKNYENFLKIMEEIEKVIE